MGPGCGSRGADEVWAGQGEGLCAQTPVETDSDAPFLTAAEGMW